MIGGQAYPNGVAFYTDEIWVKAIRGHGEKIHVEVSQREISQRRLLATSRVSSRCGSNLVVFEILCYCLAHSKLHGRLRTFPVR
jgi:hypothetical protein